MHIITCFLCFMYVQIVYTDAAFVWITGGENDKGPNDPPKASDQDIKYAHICYQFVCFFKVCFVFVPFGFSLEGKTQWIYFRKRNYLFCFVFISRSYLLFIPYTFQLDNLNNLVDKANNPNKPHNSSYTQGYGVCGGCC